MSLSRRYTQLKDTIVRHFNWDLFLSFSAIGIMLALGSLLIAAQFLGMSFVPILMLPSIAAGLGLATLCSAIGAHLLKTNTANKRAHEVKRMVENGLIIGSGSLLPIIGLVITAHFVFPAFFSLTLGLCGAGFLYSMALGGVIGVMVGSLKELPQKKPENTVRGSTASLNPHIHIQKPVERKPAKEKQRIASPPINTDEVAPTEIFNSHLGRRR